MVCASADGVPLLHRSSSGTLVWRCTCGCHCCSGFVPLLALAVQLRRAPKRADARGATVARASCCLAAVAARSHMVVQFYIRQLARFRTVAQLADQPDQHKQQQLLAMYVPVTADASAEPCYR